MPILLKDLINILEEWYPACLAESWDKVGLHFGQQLAPVRKIMLALDLRLEVIEEAIEAGVDTLIVHHPPIFSPIQRFDYQDNQTKIYQAAVKADLNVFAMHTNFDRAKEGMNDILARRLELERISDLYPVETPLTSLGRVGYLKQALNRTDLLDHIRRAFDLEQLKIIEKTPQDFYQKVAILGGSGADFFNEVAACGADVFITGDVTYHKGQDLYEAGYLTVDVGHYVEHYFMEPVKERLEKEFLKNQWSIEVISSKVKTDPFDYC